MLCAYAVLLSALPWVRATWPGTSTSTVSLPLIALFGYSSYRFLRATGWPLSRFGLGFRNLFGSVLEAALLIPPFAALLVGVKWLVIRSRARTVPPARTRRLVCAYRSFVKMVHNGIEYGLMAAYAEGFNLLRHADAGRRESRADAEVAPLGDPERFLYELDVGEIAEVWRHGSVIRSWLLDLAAEALVRDPKLEHFAGRVSDSGEGRWTVLAAIEAGVPAPVLATALFARFGSRGAADFANRVLSALRYEFGGHVELPGSGKP